MHETIIPRHVKRYKDGYTYILSLAGVKTRGGHYSNHIQAAYEAELATWYFRKKYGIKWHTVRARIPEETLQGYADECGFKLTVEEVFQRLPRCLRDTLTLEGDHIAAKFAELETPTCRETLIRDGRRERQQFKLERIAAQKAASIEKAAAWRQAAEAWKNERIELEGLRRLKRVMDLGRMLGGVEVTREQALEGLGDPATWKAESDALYAEFRKKPNAT